jgi:predicted RNA-binding Zn-ribbon protein involved in translation (DUF1610 family)
MSDYSVYTNNEVHLCPNCQGQKWVQKPPNIPGDQNEWVSTGAQYPCPTCGGTGYIVIQVPIDRKAVYMEKDYNTQSSTVPEEKA